MTRGFYKSHYNSIPHYGRSMHPILKDGDILFTSVKKKICIHPGDVITYERPGDGVLISHRVVSFEAGRMRTKGDHNWNIDQYSIEERSVIGKVLFAQRRETIFRVRGGIAGRIIIFSRYLWRLTLRILLRLIGLAAYLSPLIDLGSLTKRLLNFRVYSFKRARGVELKLFLGTHVIGILPPGEMRWRIDRPFRALVAEGYLPHHTGNPGPIPTHNRKKGFNNPI